MPARFNALNQRGNIRLDWRMIRNQPRNRYAAPGDGDFFACFYLVEQMREIGFHFVNCDSFHGAPNGLTNSKADGTLGYESCLNYKSHERCLALQRTLVVIPVVAGSRPIVHPILRNGQMFDHDDIINRIIPYRLQAIDAANLAVQLQSSWDVPKSMKIYFDEKLRITGNSNAYTNPVLESGLIHCRALLDFLGLKADPADPTKLTCRDPKKNKKDDVVIEHFSNSKGPLPMVTPQEATTRYKGSRAEAEAALAGVLHTANKGLAHITIGLALSATDISQLEIASRGVRALVVSHFYTPLGLLPPEPGVTQISP